MSIEKNILLNYFNNPKNIKLDTVKELLSERININAIDKKNRTALMKLGMKMYSYCPGQPLEDREKEIEKIEIAIFLLNNGANPDTIDQNNIHSLIGFSMSDIGLPVVKKMIDMGVDVNTVLDDTSFLVEAAQNFSFSKNIETIKYLILKGADVNKYMPLKYIIKSQYFEPKTTVKEMTDLIQIFIDHGCDINTLDKNGNTALMIASENGNIEIVKILIEANADLYIKNNNNEIALDIIKKRFEICKPEEKEQYKEVINFFQINKQISQLEDYEFSI